MNLEFGNLIQIHSNLFEIPVDIVASVAFSASLALVASFGLGNLDYVHQTVAAFVD